MTHNGRENTINPDDKRIKELRAHSEKMIRAAMDKINLILARYNERTEELIATQAKEKTQMHTTASVQAMPQTQVPQPAAMPPAQEMPQAQAQQNAKPVAQPAQATVRSVAQQNTQSGTFAMVRDAVKG